jgi:hypothetical protein
MDVDLPHCADMASTRTSALGSTMCPYHCNSSFDVIAVREPSVLTLQECLIVVSWSTRVLDKPPCTVKLYTVKLYAGILHGPHEYKPVQGP